jgi:hypothetical protein
MDPLDQILFDKKTISDIVKEIYGNSKKKEKQIGILISELRPLMQSLGDATVVVPLIKEYLEVSVKNDEHLIKMVAVVQRLLSGGSGGSDSGALTEDEFEQLQQAADDLAKSLEKKEEE